jgi:hypothetical protein
MKLQDSRLDSEINLGLHDQIVSPMCYIFIFVFGRIRSHYMIYLSEAKFFFYIRISLQQNLAVSSFNTLLHFRFFRFSFNGSGQCKHVNFNINHGEC